MRIREEFKKSGYFWLPSTPMNKLPGTLEIKDGGRIELEVFGSFNQSALFKTENSLERIVGHIENLGLVTLENCSYKSQNISFGSSVISKSLIHIEIALIGAEYDHNEIILFNSFMFSTEGLDEWIGLSGITVEHIPEERTASIYYSPIKEISLTINNSMQLLIVFSYSLPFFPKINEAKVSQKAYLKLVSKKAIPLNEYQEAAYRLTTLISFAIDKTISIEQALATSESIQQDIGNGNKRPVLIQVYYPSLPNTKGNIEVKQHTMLFKFEHIQNNAEQVIKKWFDAYHDFDPAINLYFSTKFDENGYLENQFLSLAQGVETYHRRTSNQKLMSETAFNELLATLKRQCPEQHQDWLSGRLRHGNEPSLSQRIKSMIEPFKEYLGNCKDRNKLIRSVVDTRNFLTHYDKSLEATAARDPIKLWELCQKMEAIFQLHLLQVLGFTDLEIKSVFDNSVELQRKLKPRE